MKHIQKGPGPESFACWKASGNESWSPSWDNFQQPQKAEVFQALLTEQGHICCYCNARIGERPECDGHIEHLKPRKDFQEFALSYENMLASCDSSESCGHKKGDWHDDRLTVSPLDSGCEELFVYNTRGEMLAGADRERREAVEETIRRLGLNGKNLIGRRKARLDAVRKTLLEKPLAKQKILNATLTRDESGKYRPFCMMAFWFLTNYA